MLPDMRCRDDTSMIKKQQQKISPELYSPIWRHHLNTLTRPRHVSSSTCFLEPPSQEHFTIKPEQIHFGVFPRVRSTWHRKLRAKKKYRKRKSWDRLWRWGDVETEVVAFSLPAHGEDRPCFVKRFLPAELFSQYQSKRDHQEISGRKRRLHVYPEFSGSPWHTAHSVNRSVYCHFNSHSCCCCRWVLCTGQISVRTS